MMGGKWSILAKAYDDITWEYSSYGLSLMGFIFKGIYCLVKYDVVVLGKHGMRGGRE